MKDIIRNYDYEELNEKNEIFVSKISDKFDFSEGLFNNPFIVNFYIIVYITNGNYTHNVNDNNVPIKKGEVIIICPLQTHTFYFPVDVEGVIIAFTEKYLVSVLESTVNKKKYELLNNLNTSTIIQLSDFTKSSVDKLVELLTQELKMINEVNHKEIIDSLLITFMFTIYRNINDSINYTYNKKERYLVAEFKILILKDLNHSYSINYYAEKLNTSVRSLQLATKESFNKTPKEIINNYLLITAKLQLSDPNSTIKEIAYNLGFTDATVFSKFFKKHVKLSPLEYKRTLIKKNISKSNRILTS